MNQYNDKELDVNLELTVKLSEAAEQAIQDSKEQNIPMFEKGALKRAEEIVAKGTAEHQQAEAEDEEIEI